MARPILLEESEVAPGAPMQERIQDLAATIIRSPAIGE